MEENCENDGKISQAERQKALAARLGKIRHKILVMSGKGGVGKSTVAANLAVALSEEGYRVGLLDVDVHGPTIPHLLNLRGRRPGMTPNQVLTPVQYNDRLKVMSIAFVLEGRDTAVIWRGPMKHGVIEQLLRDVDWGECDYLIIDSPPGTGDEPLSVCQLVTDADGAILVTTPQAVATEDVRKSITFCRQVNMPVLGVVENMSGYTCPHCGKPFDIFSAGGGQKMAGEMDVPFLGRLPFDPRVVESGDAGAPYVKTLRGEQPGLAFQAISALVVQACETEKSPSAPSADATERTFAVPLADGKLAMHFGHCAEFAFVTVDAETSKVTKTETIGAPEHEPGLLPRWLAEHGAKTIIAGGMGSRAQQLFCDQGIEVVTGAPALPADDLVAKYLDGSLETGANVCDH